MSRSMLEHPRIAIVCTVVLAGFCGFYFGAQYGREAPPLWADHISFNKKFFYDSVETRDDGFVEVTGALAGQGIGYPDNATTLSCYKERHECFVSSVEQIGPSQIGRLTGPTSYPIIEWDQHEIVATNGDKDTNDCQKITISLDRHSKMALWVEEPINQGTILCKNSDTKIYKWTLDDPPFWKILNAAQAAKH